MKKFYLCIAGLLLLAPLATQAHSLQDALEAAYAHHPRLKSERERLMSANENAPQALAEWLPNVSADASVGKRNIDFGPQHTQGTVNSKSLTLTQPLFNGGGSIARMKQANHQALAARAKLMQARQDVFLETITAYLDMVRHTEFVDIAKNNAEVLAQHLEEVQERARLGDVSKTDVAQAESRHALAVARKMEAHAQLEGAKAAFFRATGLAAERLELPEHTLVSVGTDPLPTLIKQAENTYPTVMAARYELQEAEREVSVQKSKLLPSVSLNASKVNEDSVVAFSNNTKSDTETVTIDFTVPLFQSGAEYSRVRQAKHSVGEAEQLLEDAKEQLRQSIIQSYHNVHAAKTTITSTEAAVNAADIALDGVIEEAKSGIRTVLDVLDAEQELFEVKQELITAKCNYQLYTYTLLSYLGRLNIEELGLEVDMFSPEKHYDDVRFKIMGF